MDKYYKPGEGLDLGARAGSDKADPAALEALVQEKIAQNKVFLFCKTRCPSCMNAKKALDGAGIEYQVMEASGAPCQQGLCATVSGTDRAVLLDPAFPAPHAQA